MHKKDIYQLSALEITGKVAKKQIRAVEVALSFAKRIKFLEKKIKAWAYFNEDTFVKEARSIDKKIASGECSGRLLGLPVGVKDIFNTKEMPTSMGNVLWKDFNPGNDARIIFKLRDEGGMAAGKTHTAELAVHEPGPTRNPHNINYYPGTSSSGSAAAVATAMVPVALGTQTAGSIIRPASYCGVYGFKPTFGLIPRTGVLKTTDTLDQIGWFARNIDDIEFLFDALRVKGINYPYVYKFIDKKLYDEPIKKRYRVAVIKHPKWNHVEQYADKKFSNFVSKLSKFKEIIIEETKLPLSFNDAHYMHEIIYDKELAYYFQKEYKNKRFMSNTLSAMIERGLGISVEEYRKAQAYQVLIRNRLNKFFKNYDVIITLSTSGQAPEFSNPVEKPDSCLIWTLCGTPVINLPVFKGPNRLPFGLQVVARRYGDLELINFAKKLKEYRLAKDVEPVL